MIDADVTELIARVPLPAGADMLEVVLRELERIFLEDSGLAEARPGVRVPVSRPAHYLELLENVQVHGYHMMRDGPACSRTPRSRRTGATRSTRQRSPRSTACASAASTGTRRPATCSSSSTGTGAMHSPRPGARTRANRRLGDRRRRRRRRLGLSGLGAVRRPRGRPSVPGRRGIRSSPKSASAPAPGLVLLVLSAAAALAWFGLVPGHSECFECVEETLGLAQVDACRVLLHRLGRSIACSSCGLVAPDSRAVRSWRSMFGASLAPSAAPSDASASSRRDRSAGSVTVGRACRGHGRPFGRLPRRSRARRW